MLIIVLLVYGIGLLQPSASVYQGRPK